MRCKLRLTWKDKKELAEEDGEEKDDEEDLSSVVLLDGFERNAVHEAFEVNGLAKHALKLILKFDIKGILDHLDGRLATFGDCVAPRALQEQRAHGSS